MLKSESIAELTKALTAAQGEFPKVVKGHQNPFYQSWYADLGDIIEATGPALRKHGLAVIQLATVVRAEGQGLMPMVQTVLSHSSGEWISGECVLPATKQDAQAYGSAITYARRYGYQAILSIAAEDDDGNAASQPDKKKRQAAPPPAPKAPEPRPEPTSSAAGDFLMLNISEVTKEQTKGGKPYLWVRDGRKSVACFKAELYDAINGQLGENVTFRIEHGSKGPHIVGIASDADDNLGITDKDLPPVLAGAREEAF